jgi:hypothetical protein
MGTASGSNVRNSAHGLPIRRNLQIRRRHRRTQRDTVRGGRAQILRIRATVSRLATCLGLTYEPRTLFEVRGGRREGRQRSKEEPGPTTLRAHRESRGPPESAPANSKAPLRPDSLRPGDRARFGESPSSSWFRTWPQRHSPRPPEPQPSSSEVAQVRPTADLARLRAPLVPGSGWRRQSKILSAPICLHPVDAFEVVASQVDIAFGARGVAKVREPPPPPPLPARRAGPGRIRPRCTGTGATATNPGGRAPETHRQASSHPAVGRCPTAGLGRRAAMARGRGRRARSRTRALHWPNWPAASTP